TLASVSPVQRLLDAPRAEPRMNAMVLALFAGAAVSLAGIGLFAVIATMVRQRTRELGIRMVLGATGREVRNLVMLRGFRLAAAGAIAGIAGSLASGPLLSGLLFETSATDVPTMLSVAILILAVAAVASLLPARASSRIDPVAALRSET
ncbi:MAG TPA: FtsX-like permease family protein, partial [Gemmatimonadaceae bacterium]|nr:FtsX-like permease family protein [Gemmatimonadaceae bacterium]